MFGATYLNCEVTSANEVYCLLINLSNSVIFNLSVVSKLIFSFRKHNEDTVDNLSKNK
jgi:hypothetical protein